MNTMIGRFLVPLFVVMSMLYAFHSCRGESVKLNKVYHHKAMQSGYLEIASLMFYFSQQPEVCPVNDTCFFFPNVVIDGKECEAMVQRINQENNGYTITIEPVMTPRKGVQVTFMTGDVPCTLMYASCDSIQLQKGIIFRLYNKNVVGTLQSHANAPILKTASIKKPRIVIDPGHGGCDAGTMGLGGMYEKNICLAIGTEVVQLLQHQGYCVLLTRDTDSDVPLDMRTTYANEKGADLFVSIHANHSPNAKVIGVETFYASPRLFTSHYSGLSKVDNKSVATIMHKRSDDAYKLATAIQKNVCNAVASYHSSSVNRSVKQAVSQVLVGTQMPSVLIEVGFLSNHAEAGLLNSTNYQHTLAQAIANGIVSFFVC